VIGIIAVVAVGILAFLGFKLYKGGEPVVEGTESMPPAVREAYSHHGAPPPAKP